MSLLDFVAESNQIEGIFSNYKLHRAKAAHDTLLAKHQLTVADVEEFVKTVAGKPLRDKKGLDVRVGSHIAPPGGPEIRDRLAELLERVNAKKDPYLLHIEYESLHPFLDGNGRSGRAIWLWQMLRFNFDSYVLDRGFLHAFYYQTLKHAQ